MIADARRYTKREKQAYRARQEKRREPWMTIDRFLSELDKLRPLEPWQRHVVEHHFADNLGRRVPTMRPKGEVL
jgi:hypothetical protein